MRNSLWRILSAALFAVATTSTDAAQIYWNDGGLIHRSALDGSGVQNVAGTFSALGIAVDQNAGLYWTDDIPRVPIGSTGTIRHASLNGSSETDLLPGIQTPIGVALDVIHGKMYWTAVDNVIRRANLDGSDVETLISQPSIADLSGIVVDPADNRFYFSFVNPLVDSARPGGIGVANLDGSSFKTVVPALVLPQGLGLDPVSGDLYWADADRIQRAPVAGGAVQDLVTGLKQPFGLALDLPDRLLFWTDRTAGTIDRAPLSGGAQTDVLINLSNPTAIALLGSVPEPSSLVLASLALVLLSGTLLTDRLRAQLTQRRC